MRYLQIALILIFIAICSCDPVNCTGAVDSIYGKYTYCNSSKPFPLKIETGILVNRNYGFSQYSWKYWLANYKGQITNVTGCLQHVPVYGPLHQGDNITIQITCYQMPRQLAFGDYIQIQFFRDVAPYDLVYLVPIIGYSTFTQPKILANSQIQQADELNVNNVNNLKQADFMNSQEFLKKQKEQIAQQKIQ